MQGLEEYKRKRNFAKTPEPAGQLPPIDTEGQPGGRFVIHKHAARNLHYDLRLEQGGVFKSWAVPKGPSLEPGEKRLAVKVEDHPLEYGDFEGVIPRSQYGGGTVMLWDRGQWAALPQSKSKKRRKSEDRIDFVLDGEKLRGAWTLVRSSGRSRDGDNWLLIKRHDNAQGQSQLTDLSVATGRSMEQIARDKDRTWTQGGEASEAQRVAPDPAEIKNSKKEALPRKPDAALATLAAQAPDGDQWLHEIKFDGYRILSRIESGKIKLISRNHKDWTRRFPELAKLLSKLACDAAVLDGEVVALGADGVSSFHSLQEALASETTHALIYQAFDLLHLNGYSLRSAPLQERKQALEALLTASGFTGSANVRFSAHIQGQGPAFLEQACRLGLEGIISKKAGSQYRAGRSRNWLKVKCSAREELLICGYTEPGGSRSGFGALLLAGWKNKKLVYAGKVGTGFSQRDLRDLHSRLKKLEITESLLTNPPNEKGIHWVTPELVAEIEFTEWTRDGVLRHPSFQGLREDKNPREIQLPDPSEANALAGSAVSQAAKTSRGTHTTPKPRRRANEAEVAGVRLTNPDRVLYPEEGITKLDLAEYYVSIEQWLLPHLAHRPLSLVRCPSGYTEECFFQKHPRQTISRNVPRVMIDEKKKPSPYLYVKTIGHVIALVQIGALELHIWGSRVEDVERPDNLVFDLDPAPDLRYSELLRVARDLRDRLHDLGLATFPRTTGGKGLHLVVPIVPDYGWDTIKAFCQGVAKQHAREDRQRVTAVMSKARRQGRVFLDYLRNGRGATAIASYSTRARPGATVAVPITWDELSPALRPDRYSVSNLRRRLAVLKDDPWKDFERARQPLTASMLNAVGVELK
ncbi:DNA ligase D [Gilvimarinus sp. F26214L]|uniref:DNA ligase D n=1 Tax=Gilvimarinus sp. DZF01 TaxID=3461371 RepID=UPI0040464E26